MNRIESAFDLTGRVAVVTGAASGIGLETASVLTEAGARVIVSDRDDEATMRAADSLDGAVPFAADVTDRSAVSALADAAESLGPISIWVNSAGVITTRAVVSEMTEEALDLLIGVNLKGTFWGAAEAVRRMTATKTAGSIVNLSSFGGENAVEGLSGYAITKAGVNMLTRTLAKEVGPAGIRVNAVAPGFVETNMVTYQYRDEAGHIDEKRRTAYLEMMASGSPLKRIGTTTDIALAILYLAADASGFTTGQILRPNGGTSMV
ncbi:MAG: short-chain dehydrogenase/reductase [Subtercola sp.]|nr:short-chain dehydrogenase/reductase [Subtercola sp.]